MPRGGRRVGAGRPRKRKTESPPASDAFAKVPTPSAWLTDDAKDLWKRVAGEFVPEGKLRPQHLPALELLCCTYARWREAFAEARMELVETPKGFLPDPMLAVEQKYAHQYRMLLAEFRLTMASERGAAAAKPQAPKASTPMAEILRRRKALRLVK